MTNRFENEAQETILLLKQVIHIRWDNILPLNQQPDSDLAIRN